MRRGTEWSRFIARLCSCQKACAHGRQGVNLLALVDYFDAWLVFGVAKGNVNNAKIAVKFGDGTPVPSLYCNVLLAVAEVFPKKLHIHVEIGGHEDNKRVFSEDLLVMVEAGVYEQKSRTVRHASLHMYGNTGCAKVLSLFFVAIGSGNLELVHGLLSVAIGGATQTFDDTIVSINKVVGHIMVGANLFCWQGVGHPLEFAGSISRGFVSSLDGSHSISLAWF